MVEKSPIRHCEQSVTLPESDAKLVLSKRGFQTFDRIRLSSRRTVVWDVLTHGNAAENRENIHCHLSGGAGWDGRSRTYSLLYQKQVPYHLATSQQRGADYSDSRHVARPESEKFSFRGVTFACDQFRRGGCVRHSGQIACDRVGLLS